MQTQILMRVALGNFLHFVVVTIVLVKTAVAGVTVPVMAGTAAYAVFALWFGLVLFTLPGTTKPGEGVTEVRHKKKNASFV